MTLLTPTRLGEPAFAAPSARSLAGTLQSSAYRPLVLALPICAAILAGIAAGSGPLTIAAVVAALGAAVVSPPTGLAIFAVMAALKSPALPAPGFNTFLVAAILLGCVYRLPIDRPTLRPGLPLLLLLAFIFYAGVQQTPALAAGYGDQTSHHIGYLFIQLATLGGLALASAYVLRGRATAPFLVAGVLGALIAALLAIAVYVLPPGAAGNLVDFPDATSRVVGPFGDPNYFGLFQATAIAACLATMVIVRSRRWRLALAAVSIVLGLVLAITLSRAALAALAAGVVALAFTRSRRAGFAIVSLLAVLAFIVYPLFHEWRLTADAGALSAAQASTFLGKSDASRIAAALAGPQMFATSPIFGIGFGQYPLMTPRFLGYSIESHNWYMNVLAEQGLVGVAMWLPILASTALQLIRSRPAPRAVGLSVFVTYAVGSTFLQPPLSVQTSALAVILIVAALVGNWSLLAPTAPGPLIAGSVPLVRANPVSAAQTLS